MPNMFSKKSAHRMYAPQPELQRGTVKYILVVCMCEPKLFGEPSDYLNFVMRLRREKGQHDGPGYSTALHSKKGWAWSAKEIVTVHVSCHSFDFS